MKDNVFAPEALFDFERTQSADIFEGCEFAWEAIGRIQGYIIARAGMLSEEEYENPFPGVYISREAKVAKTACISGPCIIEAGAEIRHCAFIRGSAIIGRNSVVGNSTELKNVILFDGVQVPHYNYVGDSILGYKAHMGAGAIASNVRSDKKNVTVKTLDGGKIETGLRKFGAILGDNVEVGCGSVLNPGTVVCRGARIYPLSSVRGTVPGHSIYKRLGEIVEIAEQ